MLSLSLVYMTHPHLCKDNSQDGIRTRMLGYEKGHTIRGGWKISQWRQIEGTKLGLYDFL